MRVFVTGAGGFIGSAVARALVARNHDVVALLHSAAKVPPAAGVAVVVGDVTRRETFEGDAKDADAIVHLALPSADAPHRKAYPVWTRGTANLLAVARERDARSFVLASGAGGTYRHDPGAWIDERTPEHRTSRFARRRGEADALVLAAHREHGLSTSILRPNFAYGPGGAFRRVFVDWMRRGRYRVVGDGSNVLPVAHVEDVAYAFALAAEKAPRGDVFLVADDGPMTLRAISDAIADALGVKRPGTVPPVFAGLVAGRDAVALLTESFRIRNAKLRTLGWSPRYPTLREGLPDAIR